MGGFGCWSDRRRGLRRNISGRLLLAAIFSPVIGVVGLVVPAVIGPLTGQSLNGLELAGVFVAVPAVVLVVAEGNFPSVDAIRSSPALGLGVLTGALIGAPACALARSTLTRVPCPLSWSRPVRLC